MSVCLPASPATADIYCTLFFRRNSNNATFYVNIYTATSFRCTHSVSMTVTFSQECYIKILIDLTVFVDIRFISIYLHARRTTSSFYHLLYVYYLCTSIINHNHNHNWTRQQPTSCLHKNINDKILNVAVMFAEQESRLSFMNVLLKSKLKLSAFFTSDGKLFHAHCLIALCQPTH